MASTTSFFVTGSSRGLGLALVTQSLLREGTTVYAAARSTTKSPALQDLAAKYGTRLHLVELDVTNEQHIQEAAQKLDAAGVHLDVLINNASKGGVEPFLDINQDEFLSVLNVNVVGPYLTTKHLLPFLKKGRKKIIINIGSDAGSSTIMLQDTPPAFAAVDKRGMGYRVSKAALHYESAFFAKNLREEGFTVVSMHPGWLDTDMGRAGAAVLGGFTPPTTPQQGAEGILKAMDGLDPLKHNGKVLTFDGIELPF